MYNECSMSNVATGPIDLRDRTLSFSKDVIRYAKTIKFGITSQPIINQLVKSSTSVGANFIEAKNAGSNRDFLNKVYISKKEASETLYWLRICEEFGATTELKQLQDECQKIILILQKIVNKMRH